VVAIREFTPAEQMDALVSGKIDIGFTRTILAEARHLVHHEILFHETVLAALPRGHDLAAESAVPLTALAEERIVLYCRGGAPAVFDSIIAMCRKAKFSPRIADTPSSWQAVLTVVEAGEGIALVPECVQHLRATDIVFRPLRPTGCRLDAIVAWRRGDSNAMLEGFLALLRDRPQ
jgi:DNA-binding transcriptional LysR family regulator